MSIILLDSGHTHPVGGQQAEWLKNTLEAREKIPYKIAIYHVPAFPSVRPWDNQYCKEVCRFLGADFRAVSLEYGF